MFRASGQYRNIQSAKDAPAMPNHSLLVDLWFFGVIWFAFSWVGALLVGQVLHRWPDDEEEEEPVVNFHQRRQQVKR